VANPVEPFGFSLGHELLSPRSLDRPADDLWQPAGLPAQFK
jgi:hypothetical protein